MTETAAGRIVVDGRAIEAHDRDSVAIAIVRAGEAPGRGGTLCLAGDCGNCLAQVDGVAYVRTCQTAARPGMAVVRHPAGSKPPLPVVAGPDLTSPPVEREVPVWRVETDVAVIGGGTSDRAVSPGSGGFPSGGCRSTTIPSRAATWHVRV